MNKAVVKRFAIEARGQLIDAITQKAYQLGITKEAVIKPEVFEGGFKVNQRLFKPVEMKQREELISVINEKGFEQVIEEVAYTWFNRFIALRFMEVNDYLPTGVRVLSSEIAGKVEPDIVAEALNVELDLDREFVYQLQDKNETEQLFKYLLMKQCNALHEILPIMFEEINDYTELLLPDQLLSEGSVIDKLVKSIDEDDWRNQVEIIGWLYQFYISEKKDQVFEGLKKNQKITKENIPAATQLFTPKWIVKYMVENSVGRLWLDSHPNPELQASWNYFIAEAEQTDQVLAQLKAASNGKKSPEDITILDPCMGSGHILVYAFDVLYQIYVSAGYASREIPKLILEKNLYGLDIDDRAAQLAYFAVMMKARSYHRRVFREQIQVNFCSIQESNLLSKEAVDFFVTGQTPSLEKDVLDLIATFNGAKEYGSILSINKIDFEGIEARLQEIEHNQEIDLFEAEYRTQIMKYLPALILQGKLMTMKYDVVITNPPYMGSRGMNGEISKFVKKNYPQSKLDMYAIFMEVGLHFLKEKGFLSLINQHSWMFISGFKDLRKKLLETSTIYSMVHLGTKAFEEIGGEVVQTTAFIARKTNIHFKGTYVRLVDQDEKESQFFNQNLYFHKTKDQFQLIPDQPIVYWIDESFILAFEKGISIDSISSFTGSQNVTGQNERYLRKWWEVSHSSIEEKEWVFYAKGGNYRKHYGNLDHVVDWREEARNFYRTNKTSNLLAKEYWYKEGITYTDITTRGANFRYFPPGCVFDKAGPAIVEVEHLPYMLALLNSKVADYFLSFLNPTLHVQVKDIKNIPIIINEEILPEISALAEENIAIAKQDWDSLEQSFEFQTSPILEVEGASFEEKYKNLQQLVAEKRNRLIQNEEKINRYFIDLYGVSGLLDESVSSEQLSVRTINVETEVKDFISFAVGCMFGRYSLEKEVKRAEDPVIIPITDEEYFDDDIVVRFALFLKTTMGEEKLEENLEFIAHALKKKGTETARQAIRRYFLKDFFKDHVQMFKKRPIYWLFDSGKQNGFQALTYYHKIDETVVATVRTEYLHVLQRKYESEMERLTALIDSDVSEREKVSAKVRKEQIVKQLIETQSYDQVIAHVANKKRRTIDINDGIKLNYEQFQKLEVAIGEGSQTKKMSLFAEIKL